MTISTLMMTKQTTSPLLDTLRHHTLLCDGAMGSQVQAMDLTVDGDFQGCENCTEILNASRPDVVKAIHTSYLEAGADCIQTNSFGSSVITLGEFGLSERAFELSQLAAELARECVDAYVAQDGKPRYVLGSIGPGTKLPSLGHVGYEELLTSIQIQAEGLLAGGVDAFLIETCQDPLQIKAAIEACKRSRSPSFASLREQVASLPRGIKAYPPVPPADNSESFEIKNTRKYIPIFVQVTVETTGSLLVGTDIQGVMGVLSSMGIDGLGMNCATGPKEMEPHLEQLAESWPALIFVQPNAGLPCLKHGKTHYDLTPDQLATALNGFIDKMQLNMVGGCCGTTPDHIRALRTMLNERILEPSPLGRGQGEGFQPTRIENILQEGVKHYPPVKPRAVTPEAKVASLYSAVTLRQENAFFAIGERCNANGSKAFREAQAARDWDTCIAMAQEQEREGSHALDVCTAYVGRDEVADMTAFLERLRGSVSVPLVIDSTELPVIQKALALYGGKAIVNSINFEDGEAPAHARMKLVSQHGAAVIALTIDEAGMAKTVEDKLRITKRLIDFCQEHYNTPIHDILIDPLTFTICTGNEDDRKLGLWTLEAMAEISRLYPNVQIVLGLSNISFGLKPPARRVLNSVYLHEAVKHGMTGAIVHVSKIMPMHQIDAAQRQAALDLIYDNRQEDDPLQRFMALFTGVEASSVKKDPLAHLPEPIEERLKQRIIDGVKIKLDDDLALAMKTYAPLDIINTLLLEGMKVVGELFGSGQMQLPFVLQSAETMKAAVAYLEPFMEKVAGQTRGTVVLATVKGDVHDIGKNLVDIILTNNGYTVHNLGIKQHLDDILNAVEIHQPDAVGLSGLLVKSTVIMRENMVAMQERGLTLPVFLGGAALTREYVEVDCYDTYPHVAYVKDAFESLDMMARIMAGEFDAYTAQQRNSYVKPEENTETSAVPQQDDAPVHVAPVIEVTPATTQQAALDSALYLAHTGGKIETPTVEQLLRYVNLFNVFTRNWGFHPPEAGESEADWRTRLNLDGILHETLNHPEVKKALKPRALWGLIHASSTVSPAPALQLRLSRQADAPFATWNAPVAPVWGSDESLSLVQGVSEVGDPMAIVVATLGEEIATLARTWFKEDRYQQYLYLHGVLGELAQAIPRWLRHQVILPYGAANPGVWLGAGMSQLPDLSSQAALLKALDAKQRLGIEFLEEGLTLSHEDSTTGFLLWNQSLEGLGW